MKKYTKPGMEVIDLSRKNAILTSGDCEVFFECTKDSACAVYFECTHDCECYVSLEVGEV